MRKRTEPMSEQEQASRALVFALHVAADWANTVLHPDGAHPQEPSRTQALEALKEAEAALPELRRAVVEVTLPARVADPSRD